MSAGNKVAKDAVEGTPPTDKDVKDASFMSSKVEARLLDLARGSIGGRRRKAVAVKRKRDDAAPSTPTSCANPPDSFDATAGKDPTPAGDKAKAEATSREGSPAAKRPAAPAGKDQPPGQNPPQPAPKEERERSKRGRSRRRDATPPLSGTGPTTPNSTLEDIGGVRKVLEQLNELVGFPLAHPELFTLLGTEPISGILIHGPPGTGKTRLCHALAHALGVPFFALNGPEVVSGVSGDSEARLRSLFNEAAAAAPALMLLDEVDAIAGKREDAGKAMEARIVSQLQTCMDDLGHHWKKTGKAVMVLAATNRPEVIEPALRRSGRFDREIGLGIPSLTDRIEILTVLTRGLRMAPDVDLRELGFLTPGFVGADLHAIVKEASMICMKHIRNVIVTTHMASTQASPTEESGVVKRVPIPEGLDIEEMAFVSAEHFRVAVTRVQPSSMREGFSTIPDVEWADVGALEDIRSEMERWVQLPIRYPVLYKRMGLGQPAGLLLFGPPGCGKTLVAKAIAHEAAANFISVKGPELLNKYVGESERAVRMVFARGRASAPCVLFFDELDALAPRRGLDRSTPGAERLVNQLLTEMDGVEGRDQVFVIAATNRVDMIDPAMLRPGRFDKVLYVPLPDKSQRESVLRTLCRKTPLHPDVDLRKIALDSRCTGLSGADLKGLVREAAMSAVCKVFRSSSATATEDALVTQEDFEFAVANVRASVSEEERAHYEKTWLRRQREQGR
ncbi:putative AAA domain-containing protein C16E9.10c [Diplonema papillatum]|nr:putative AAA domain-containing protein C16E9.10c [Diplonema papillatum]